MAYDGKLQFIIDSTLSDSTSEIDTLTNKSELRIRQTDTFTSANNFFALSSAVGAGGTDTYDFSTITNPLNQSVSFSKVYAVYLSSTSASASDMAFGGGVKDIGFFTSSADSMVIPASMQFALDNPTGWAVSDGLTDTITISGTADDPYDLVVIGLTS